MKRKETLRMEYLETRFHLKEKGTDIRTEVMAGITTFMAMAYILMVNASMFSELDGVTYGAIYIATAISAIIGTTAIGLLANLPLAQASAMGLNAYFVYTVCFGMGLSYANALVLVLFDGLLFIFLTVTGLRKKIYDAIPATVRLATPTGIGLFIAFLGFQNAGIVVPSESTGVTMASMNLYGGNATWGEVMPMLVTIFSLLAISVMEQRKIKGGILFGVLGGTAAYYLLGFTIPGFYDGFADKITMNPFQAFSEFFQYSFGKVFTEGLDFSAFIEVNGIGGFIMMVLTTVLAFCMVDMFDTLATLYGACAQGQLLDEDGEVPNLGKAMIADAIATTCGSICGTSTVSTFVESAAGIGEGGRTGLTSLVTSGCFVVAMFLSPVAQLIPSCATAAALVYVGVLMMSGVGKIHWTTVDAVPAFLTIVMMPFTYSVSHGIAFGLIGYTVILAFSGRRKEINPTTIVVALMFALTFFVTH